MGTIIEFPGNDARREKEYREILESGLNIQSESLSECVKSNVAAVLVKYSKLPNHSFTLELPASLSAAENDILVNKIQEEVKNYASKIQKEMLLEIIKLHVSLCKHEQI